MTDFPLSLGDVLTVMGARKGFKHLSLTETTDGRWQASMKPPGTSKYALCIKDDPVSAILGVLHPGKGLSWTVALGAEFEDIFAEYEAPPEDILGPLTDEDGLEDIL